MLLSILVALSLGKPLIPWSIIEVNEVNEEDQSFMKKYKLKL